MPLAGRPFPQRRRVPGRCECVRLLDVRERFSELCARHAGHTLSAYFLGFHVIPLISTVSGHGPSHCHRRGSGHRIVARPHAVHGPSHAVHGCWLAEAKACGFTAHGGLLLQLNGLWLRARRARQRGATSSDVRGMPLARPKFAPARAAGSRRKRQIVRCITPLRKGLAWRRPLARRRRGSGGMQVPPPPPGAPVAVAPLAPPSPAAMDLARRA